MKPIISDNTEFATDLTQIIYVSVELSQSKWLVTSFIPAIDTKMARKGLPAGEAGQLLSLLSELRSKAQRKTGEQLPIVMIQEAGLDGFWVHRVVVKEGMESYVVDPTSIAVPRKARRAKTDRIDGESLVRALMAFKRGEPRVCAMVRVPSHDEEDRRRLLRERKALVVERLAHANRIEGLLFAQGISDYRPLNRDRRSRLEDLRTGDGRPLPPFLKAQISRELDRLELVIEQIKAIEAERDRLLAPERNAANSVISMLENVRGIGPEFASLLWVEGFYRHFDNRRQIAAYAGLAPTPWQSGSVDRDQGVSKAGNARLRTTMIQVAWLWVRHQPDSALTNWFRQRAASGGAAQRKKIVVALARKLLVALWKYVSAGVVIEGARLKNA
ncbi:MAG: IS110 family transposase [Hoeflea sp.]|uniref:IS110 family transposase n=1 Tax=Hoeflea sp. TaxID=1940281 RepID=UPI002730F8C3|nr:IS110 family transposase [Hoeflea sp.]MDP2119562.1 IS110 family transposase [Hoeflea sp.]